MAEVSPPLKPGQVVFRQEGKPTGISQAPRAPKNPDKKFSVIASHEGVGPQEISAIIARVNNGDVSTEAAEADAVKKIANASDALVTRSAMRTIKKKP